MANNIKRFAINILLAASFALLIFVITRPLLAQVSCDRSDFKSAVRIDPFDSHYLAGVADSILKEAAKPEYEAINLNRAIQMYDSAVELNPTCAEYPLRLGQVELILFNKDTGNRALIKSAFDNFRRALKFDPNGFNISYSVGYAGISVWKFLDRGQKEFVLERLKYSLRVKPSYSKYIYPKLWNETADLNLLRKMEPPGREPDGYISRLERLELIRNTAKRTLNVANVVIESDWQGRADDKKNVYVNGNMYWAGTIDAAIRMPRGKTTIKIQAKGTPADGIFPYITVELDGKMIGEAYIGNTEWKPYTFTINTDGGIKVLSVTFVNDGANPAKGEDRNLYIGRAEAI